MAFILAPYNNAMRLGQGFNTYTQQICIDDAVVVDPQRAENVLTNDGSTMRILVQSMGRPSAWSRQTEVVVDERHSKIEAPAKQNSVASTKPKKALPSKATVKALEAPASTKDNEAETSAKPKKAVPSKAAVKALEAPAATKADEAEASAAEDSDDAEEDTPPGSEETQAEEESEEEDPQQDQDAEEEKEEQKDDDETGDAAAESTLPDADPKGEAEPEAEASKEPVATRKRASSAGAKPASTIKRGKTATALATAEKPQKDSAAQGPDDVDWSIYTSQPTAVDKKEKEALMKAERERELEEKQLKRQREKERLEAEKERKVEEKRRREERRKMIDWGASTKGYSKEELEAMKQKIEFEERFNGMLENKEDYDFDTTVVQGPSQVVTYTSRFVDKLSDITDDMNISGGLSIKAGKFGGSGRGAFIDSDKFKESDLNFYISVKVVNQTINFKDPLQFNPLRSVNSENFREVFGDGFISGFQEGGEFNALVSMKILNKAKKTDIRAEAKVAFTAGPVDVTAEANVNIAKANIETNTETTIQVSWSGGGHIKPREQQWDIKSLMQAAARFPDLVALCPQRTYAIITKYESLRSFVKNKPEGYTPLQYENAQIYTNAMMDAYMSYKSLYTKLGSNIFDVQSKVKEIRQWTDGETDTKTDSKDDDAVFPASVKGLEDARRAIRRQMAVIVNEVDDIEKNPRKATLEDHVEPYQSPAAFEERIPKVEAKETPKIAAPLGGKRIMTKTQTEEEHLEDVQKEFEASEMPPLTTEKAALSMKEQSDLENLEKQRLGIGQNLRVTVPVGSETKGAGFNNLEFLQADWNVTLVQLEIVEGALGAIRVHYDNGLILSRGKARNGRLVELSDFRPGERITAASIQTGKAEGTNSYEPRVISLQLHTNRGRSLIGQALKCSTLGDKKQSRDGITYTDITTQFFDAPLKDGTLKGFWGRSDDLAIWRLGLIWGDLTRVQEATSAVDLETFDPFTEAFVAQEKEFQARLDERLKAKEAEHNEQRRELERRLIRWDRNDCWKRGRVQIYYILWGGAFIWNDTVARRLLDLAESQATFEFNDELFGEDPWQGFRKSGAIIYRYDDTGHMRCLSTRHFEKSKFDAF